MKSWSLYEWYNIYVRNLLVGVFYIKNIDLPRSIYVNNYYLLRTLSFIIRIHVGVHLGLWSTIIISHVRYASIIIIIHVRLGIFYDGVWIILSLNTTNENSIPPPRFSHSIPSHKRAMLVASFLWLTFVDKRRGGYSQFPVLIRSDMVCYRHGIGFPLSWTLGQIGVLCHPLFVYVIFF